MEKEVIQFFNKNFGSLGYRERKVFLASFEDIKLEEDKKNHGLYRISSPYGSFEFAWDMLGYPKGTILG